MELPCKEPCPKYMRIGLTEHTFGRTPPDTQYDSVAAIRLIFHVLCSICSNGGKGGEQNILLSNLVHFATKSLKDVTVRAHCKESQVS